jgi:NAD(P)-dependent dehydrogenase (short-subunit alcohol dehydrogenase family)
MPFALMVGGARDDEENAMLKSSTTVGPLARTDDRARRVLVTGAAGRIGSYFAAHAPDTYRLRLMVQDAAQGAAIEEHGEVVVADLGDLERLKDLCQGIDTVVHLAGDPSPAATWHSLLPTNIIGTYHTFVAAKSAGCRRVVYASSIHAVSGYPADVQVKTGDPVNPGDLYGVSKCFGEALGRYMAEQEGLSVIALRIGAFQAMETVQQESGLPYLDAFVSQRDLHQLITRCIDVEDIRFAVLHGLSDNRFKRLDISDARTLVGYAPQDDALAELPQFKDLRLRDTVKAHNRSGDGQESGLRDEV